MLLRRILNAMSLGAFPSAAHFIHLKGVIEVATAARFNLSTNLQRIARRAVAPAIVATAALIAAGCGTTTKEAQSNFCASVYQLRSTVNAIKDPTGDVTTDTLKSLTGQLKDDVRDVVDSAQEVKGAKTKDVTNSWDDLKKSIDKLKGNADDADARAAVADDATAFADSVNELFTSSDCSSSDSSS